VPVFLPRPSCSCATTPPFAFRVHAVGAVTRVAGVILFTASAHASAVEKETPASFVEPWSPYWSSDYITRQRV
jgi:hypothetical protein